GVSCSKDSFVVNQTLVFQINFCGKSPALRVAANRSEEIPSGFPRYGSGLHTSSTALRDCPRTWVSRKRETCVKPRAVVRHTRKANAQTVHLVFADTNANAEKTKRAVFCQRLKLK